MSNALRNLPLHLSRRPQRPRLAAVAFFLTLSATLGAQTPISLADALRRADTLAVANRISAGQRATRDGEAIGARRGFLPSLRLETGVMRTTDPIGVFGTTLRQRRIAATDFNPATLNFPAPLSNVSAGVVAEVPLINVDAWLGSTAATRGSDAGRAAQQWQRLQVRADVVQAWFGILLADANVSTLSIALRAGQAHVTQAQALMRNGVVTTSDAMLASVRSADIESQLAQAVGDARLARQSLAALLGMPNGSANFSSDSLPSVAMLQQLAEQETPVTTNDRPDVAAAQLGASAAQSDARRAQASRLPRINAQLRYDWNDRSMPLGGQKSWSVGVMGSWSLLSGGATLGDARATAGRESAARAMADGAATQAALELSASSTRLDIARQRVALADFAARQGTDAHRIVERRYAGGLATVTELLDAAAAETATSLGLAKARYDLIAAVTARRLARGADAGTITTALTPAARTGAPLPALPPELQ